MTRYQLGWCTDEGLYLGTPLPHTAKYAHQLAWVMNKRAQKQAEQGIFPNVVYWVQEVKEQSGHQRNHKP